MAFTDKLHFFASLLLKITFFGNFTIDWTYDVFLFLQNAMHPETTSYVVQKICLVWRRKCQSLQTFLCSFKIDACCLCSVFNMTWFYKVYFTRNYSIISYILWFCLKCKERSLLSSCRQSYLDYITFNKQHFGFQQNIPGKMFFLRANVNEREKRLTSSHISNLK